MVSWSEQAVTAMRALATPVVPRNARVEAAAREAISSQRVLRVTAKMAAKAKTFTDAVGGAMVVLLTKDKGMVEGCDTTFALSLIHI